MSETTPVAPAPEPGAASTKEAPAAPAPQLEATPTKEAPAAPAPQPEAAPTKETPAAPAPQPEAAPTKETPAAGRKSGHRASIEQLLKAGTHFGHLTSRWNPKMKKYIFMQRNNIHIIDLMQTQAMLNAAAEAAARFARMGRPLLFVGTKKQARETIRSCAESCDSPYVAERWLGGTLTNFQTIRGSIRRMDELARFEEGESFQTLKKKERLMRAREREKLVKVLSGIAAMPRLPGAVFVVDVNREHIAVKEARKLGIPIIAMIDTNCNPDLVDYAIPANDDALKSIQLVTSVIADAVNEGKRAKATRDASENSDRKS